MPSLYLSLETASPWLGRLTAVQKPPPPNGIGMGEDNPPPPSLWSLPPVGCTTCR